MDDVQIEVSVWWTWTDTGALMTYKEVPLGAAPAEHPTRSSFPMIKLQGEQARWLLGIAGQPRGPAQQETLLSAMRAVGWNTTTDATQSQLQVWPLRPVPDDFQWLSDDRRAILQRRQAIGREKPDQPRGWPSGEDYVVIMQNLREMIFPRDETSLRVRIQQVGVANRLGVTPRVVADIIAIQHHSIPPTQS